MSNFRSVEDPRIAQVAKMCCDEMLADIGALMAKGEDFFHARECVIAERENEIASTYGNEVATRALQAVKATAPEDMPWEFISAQDRFVADKALEATDFTHGGRHYWTPAQKWWQQNSNLTGHAMVSGMIMITCSPIIGFLVMMVFHSTSIFIPAIKWSAGLGLATIIAVLLVEQIIGTNPNRVKGTEPKNDEDIAKQREQMNAILHVQFMAGQEAEAEAEAVRKREEEYKRWSAEQDRLREYDKEIDAWQERRRLGTSLPTDPSPNYNFSYANSTAKPKKKSKPAPDYSDERRNGVSRPGAEGYIPPRR